VLGPVEGRVGVPDPHEARSIGEKVTTGAGARIRVMGIDDPVTWLGDDGFLAPEPGFRFARIAVQYDNGRIDDDCGEIADAFALETDKGNLIGPLDFHHNDNELQGRTGLALPPASRVVGFVYFAVPSDVSLLHAAFIAEDNLVDPPVLIRWKR
jgi:hypothetical protein